MANQVVQIELRAKDGTSQVFRTVGREAQAMGRTIDQSATQGERSLTRMSKAGAATGAAMAALGGTLRIAAQYNAEAEASQARLETAIENTGHSLFEYEDALSAASQSALQLGFDDEDAADSVAALTTATGDAERAISDLAIAEDVARGKKISLEAATKLVIAAEQGRYGALARVGVVIDETATREEALDALRAKFAGQAEAYADTEAGAMDRRKNQIENYLESVGAALGPTQQLFLMLPGLSTGFTAVGSAVGALAPSLTKAAAAGALLNLSLGPVGIVAAAIAAAGAILYFSDNLDDQFVPDTEAARTALAGLTADIEGFIAASSPLTPLAIDIGDSLTYITNSSENAQNALKPFIEAEAEAVAELENAKDAFGENSESVDFFRLELGKATAELEKQRRAQDANIVSGTKLENATKAVANMFRQTGQAGEIVRSELANLYRDQQAGVLTWEEYLDRIIQLNGAIPEIVRGLTETGSAVDGVTTSVEAGAQAYNKYFDAAAQGLTAQTNEIANLKEQIAAQDELNAKKAEYASFAAMQVQVGDYTALLDATAAIRDQEGAFYGLRDGIQSVNEAQTIFAAAQQGILSSQEPFNTQLSTYNSQLGNINDGVELLNEKRARGESLTQRELDFLEKAGPAQERLAGGVEDATFALAEQSVEYGENMSIGDKLNESTGALNDTILNLINAIHGIPGYVETDINVDATQAQNQIDHISRQMDALNGRTSYASVIVHGYYTGPNVGLNPGGNQHGGVIPHAQHGMAAPNGWFWVGEAGPELMNSQMVQPNTASREMAKQGSGSSGVTINNMTVVANDPRQFMEQMRQYRYSEARL